MIALRSSPDYQETVVYGATTPYLPERENVMAYFRKGGAQTLLVIGNFQGAGQEIPLPGAVKRVLINNLKAFPVDNGVLRAAPWQFAVLEME